MGWSKQQRGPRSGYYYRCKRIGGRPVRIYVGRGPLAELAALLDEQERQARREAREVWYAEQARIVMADMAADEARTLAELLAMAALLIEGYHTHHGQIRRRRRAG